RGLLEVAHAHGLEITPEDRLDRAIPSRLDFQRLGDPRTVREPAAFQPATHVLVALAERRLLHRLEGGTLALCRLQRRVALIHELRELLILFAELADLLGHVSERPLELVTRLARAVFLRRQPLEVGLQL